MDKLESNIHLELVFDARLLKIFLLELSEHFLALWHVEAPLFLLLFVRGDKAQVADIEAVLGSEGCLSCAVPMTMLPFLFLDLLSS